MTNLYLPPGELITIDLYSKEAAGKVRIQVNQQKIEKKGAVGTRYPYQAAFLLLTEKHNTWGFPFGGPLTFNTNFNRPIEMVVTGCLKGPYYQYGITDEEEFAKEVKTSLVPITMVDNGCVVQISRTKNLVNVVSRIDDASIYWRSMFIKSQNTVPDLYNSQFGRPWQPI